MIKSNHSYNTQQLDKVESFNCKTDIFKNSFIPSFIDAWNKLKPEIRTVDWFLKFRKLILWIMVILCSIPFINIFNLIGLKYLTHLCLELSHLNEHKFKHNFQNCINPLCTCSLEPESNSDFFLCCQRIVELMNDLKIIYENILRLSENSLVQLLLLKYPEYNLIDNCQILNASMNFILQSERFKDSIM